MSRYSKGTGQRFGILALVTLALGLRLWAIGHGLPQRFVDENNYVVSALRIAGGDLHVDFPGNSPNLHQILLILGYGIWYAAGSVVGVYKSIGEFAQTYQMDPSPFYLIGRAQSVLFSVATIWILWLMGARLRGERLAWVAAAILSLVYMDVRHAHLVEPYSLVSIMVLCSAYFCLLFLENQQTRYLILAGVLSGIATALRISFLLSLLAPILAVLLGGGWTQLKRSVFLLSVIGLSSLCGFVIGYPGVILNFDTFLRSFGVVIGNVTYGNLDGSALQFGWEYYPPLLVYTMGWPLLVMSGVGLLLALAKHDKRWPIVLSFPVTYLAVLAVTQMSFLRYTVPLMPFLALVAGLAIIRIGEVAAPGIHIHPTWVVSALCVVVLIPSLRNVIGLNTVWSRENTRVTAKRWIEENIPEGAKIAYQWGTPALSTTEDPEPFSSRVYDTRLISQNDPSEYSGIEEYRAQGFSYIILSSYIYDWARVDPSENEMRSRFYDSLETSGHLIAEFVGYDVTSGSQRFWVDDLYGPTIDTDNWLQPGPTLKVFSIQY